MSSFPGQVGQSFRDVAGWLRQAEAWQILALVVAAVVILPLMPVVLALAVLAAVVMFARAWLGEFTYLMRLGDDAFPGRNDKLIWAILLIVLPPVGTWLFQAYREAHWPEPKKAARADAFDAY